MTLTDVLRKVAICISKSSATCKLHLFAGGLLSAVIPESELSGTRYRLIKTADCTGDRDCRAPCRRNERHQARVGTLAGHPCHPPDSRSLFTEPTRSNHIFIYKNTRTELKVYVSREQPAPSVMWWEMQHYLFSKSSRRSKRWP